MYTIMKYNNRYAFEIKTTTSSHTVSESITKQTGFTDLMNSFLLTPYYLWLTHKVAAQDLWFIIEQANLENIVKIGRSI